MVSPTGQFIAPSSCPAEELLHKDDSITPALMIMCCQRLLTRSDRIRMNLQGNILYVTHYYSVLTEGALCIPWNFK
ncbi:hypothetical protein OBRU01_23804, partial [Operophtera brumata]